MAYQNQRTNQGSRDDSAPIVNYVSYNLGGDEPQSVSWTYTAAQFADKIKNRARERGIEPRLVKIKWYQNPNVMVYNKKTQKSVPEQKIVAEVWVDEDSACEPVSDKDVNPLIRNRNRNFKTALKDFINTYCSSNDRKVYEIPSARFANFVDGRRCYCFMVSIEKFCDVEFDAFGYGYKKEFGKYAQEASIFIDIMWNDKRNKERGIKALKITKSAIMKDVELENRDAFISPKSKKKHHDD